MSNNKQLNSDNSNLELCGRVVLVSEKESGKGVDPLHPSIGIKPELFDSLSQHNGDMSFHVMPPICADLDFLGSQPTDICYDYRGLTICVRDLEENSKYFVYDGGGDLLTSDNADGVDDVCHSAEAWVKNFHIEEVTGDCDWTDGDGDIISKYDCYTIRVKDLLDERYEYLIYDSTGAVIATNTSSDPDLANRCAEAWIKRYCLK